MHIYLRFILLTVFTCIFATPHIEAQVVIGSEKAPKGGSLLDLTNLKVDENNLGGANADKGLLLPRVSLQAISDLRPEGATFTGDDIHAGLMVFNLTNKPREELCVGVHVWSGTKWVNIHSGGCACEYAIQGHDGKIYYVYCDDFQGVQSSATNVCKTGPSTGSKSYHLMTADEYNQIWDRPIVNTTEYTFTDGLYFINYLGWTSIGVIANGKSNTLGIGNAFSGGAPIGGKINGSNTVRCIRD